MGFVAISATFVWAIRQPSFEDELAGAVAAEQAEMEADPAEWSLYVFHQTDLINCRRPWCEKVGGPAVESGGAFITRPDGTRVWASRSLRYCEALKRDAMAATSGGLCPNGLR